MAHHRQRALHTPFFTLVEWELRPLLARRRLLPWLALALLGLAVGMGAWALAVFQQGIPPIPIVRGLVASLLFATPFRDAMADLPQLTFGYALLRYATYLLIACCKLVLPAIVAGSLGSDRRAGRWADMQTTPLSATDIYIARAMAAALPPLSLGLLILIPFSVVALNEGVPPTEIVRLITEFAGQVLLTASVALTCSTLFRSPWSARAAAYAILWLALPTGWYLILQSWAPTYVGASFWFHIISKDISRSLTELSIVQTLLTLALCAGTVIIGIRMLRRRFLLPQHSEGIV